MGYFQAFRTKDDKAVKFEVLNPVGGDTSRVFTIQKDTHRAGSRGRVIQTITEAENNYRWKWLGGSNQEMLENNTTEPKILNELIIINASRWLSPDNLAGSEKSNRFIATQVPDINMKSLLRGGMRKNGPIIMTLNVPVRRQEL